MGWRASFLFGVLLLAAAVFARAAEAPEVSIDQRRVLLAAEIYADRPLPADPSHELDLAVIYLAGTGWAPEAILDALAGMAKIFGQCGVRLARVELVRVTVSRDYHDFHTPRSRELAFALQPPRPTFYFVADTRQQPAFDAEAIGRGNSGTRPELTDSVWVTRATRDLEIVLAHELAHVLMNSGEHSERPGNLMRDESAPGDAALTSGQCEQMRETGQAHGLLRPVIATAH